MDRQILDFGSEPPDIRVEFSDFNARAGSLLDLPDDLIAHPLLREVCVQKYADRGGGRQQNQQQAAETEADPEFGACPQGLASGASTSIWRRPRVSSSQAVARSLMAR